MAVCAAPSPPSATDAVRVFQTNLPPLDTFGDVKISGGSFGSSFVPAPGKPGYYYGITDRGPNADSGDGNNPAVRFNAPATGLYDIWIGTYGASTNVNATLTISEGMSR